MKLFYDDNDDVDDDGDDGDHDDDDDDDNEFTGYLNFHFYFSDIQTSWHNLFTQHYVKHSQLHIANLMINSKMT